MTDQGPAIEAKGLAKYYGAFVAVGGVSFSVPSGQVVALVGPNGAGKTTTMKMLTGFIAPSAGTVTIDGCDVQTDRLSASKRIGYLPENGPLYPDMTPSQTLRFFGSARGLTPSELDEALVRVVEELDLRDILDRPIRKLSKGLKQRVGLAQALLHDPEVLILDEPTAGLDPNQIRQFRALVRQLGQRKTLLVSTHILQEVEALAERVLLLNGGRLVFDGTPADMAAQGDLETAFYALTTGSHPASHRGAEPA